MISITKGLKSILDDPDKRKLFFGSFIIPLIFYIILVSINNSIFEFDEIAHYMVVKNAIVNPTDLLSPYGKPGYSILAFLAVYLTGDQFNILPIRYMNCLISSINCIFLALTLKLKRKSNGEAIFGAWLCMLTQVFYLSSISSLTEPLSAMILIMAYYYYEKKQYTINALLLSYGFLCRPEFIIVWAIFGLLYLKQRNLKAILLFGVFPLIWVIFLWLAGYSPWIIITYNAVIDTFELHFKIGRLFLGNGLYSFFYYFLNLDQIVGLVLEIFLILGVISWVVNKTWNFEITGTLLLYFVFEGILLVFPGFGSAGYWRYFVMLVPLFTFLILDGILFTSKLFKFLFKKSRRFKATNQVLSEKAILIMILIPITINVVCVLPTKISLQPDPTLAIQLDAAKYLETHFDLKSIPVYCPMFSNPFIMEYLYHPNLYVDIYYLTRTGNDTLTNYTIIPAFQGYYDDIMYTVNLTTVIPSGALIIWVSGLYNNSYFNPVNIDLNQYQTKFEESNAVFHMVIYFKL